MRSPLSSWLGGKFKLAKRIIEQIPADHRTYVEPFAGAAWVLFYKEPSKVEVLNDLNLEVINLYRCLQNHLEEFVRHFRWALVSRDEFERQRAMPPESLTDIQRAARFYYLQKTCFGGRITSPTFGASVTAPPKLNLLRIEEELSAVHLRLARVMLERLPYNEVLTRYDRPGTFFYIDPPYWGCEDDYGRGLFTRDDFQALAEQLASLKGRFLLSLNDVPEVRWIFTGFNIEEVTLRYTAGKNNNTQARELFIKNY